MFIFIDHNSSNEYIKRLIFFSECRNEEAVSFRIIKSAKRKPLESSGTNQSSESFYSSEIKNIFSSHIQLILSLRAHMELQYYLLFSLPSFLPVAISHFSLS